MQAIVAILIKQAFAWLLSSTFRQTVAVVKKWVAVAETQNGIDKRAFALDKITAELKDAGIAIAKGVVSDAVATVSPNTINGLIEQFALKYK